MIQLNVDSTKYEEKARKLRQSAVDVKLDAYEYLTKPFAPAEPDSIVSQCIAQNESMEGQPEETTHCLIEQVGDLCFVAASNKMQALYEQAKLVAWADIPILILGESGTGKEVVTRLIHKFSHREKKKFLKVNCAAMPAELLESELFGYEAGAFTGATTSKPGKFEMCNHGTMLLDEIGEMPPMLQAKLLQVLQDGTFERLGGRNTIRVDVRVLAATNINIPQALASGKFREDLYYRLNTFTLEVPPLREHPEDIPFLLKHYLAVYSELYDCPLPTPSSALVDACRKYSWPGNVRELCSFVKRLLILDNEDVMILELQEHMIEISYVPSNAGMGMGSANAGEAAANGLKTFVRNLKDGAEAEAILAALQQTEWNRQKAAHILIISYRSLLYKIKQYNLVDPTDDT
jgi:DNA-binding NtrC family response regulator